MPDITKWDVLDSCSHRDWKFPADIAREISQANAAHITIAQVFVSLENLEDAGYVEARKEGERQSFRKTTSGMRARQEARQSQDKQSPESGLKPA